MLLYTQAKYQRVAEKHTQKIIFLKMIDYWPE